jgi:hypothetical protein
MQATSAEFAEPVQLHPSQLNNADGRIMAVLYDGCAELLDGIMRDYTWRPEQQRDMAGILEQPRPQLAGGPTPAIQLGQMFGRTSGKVSSSGPGL